MASKAGKTTTGKTTAGKRTAARKTTTAARSATARARAAAPADEAPADEAADEAPEVEGRVITDMPHTERGEAAAEAEAEAQVGGYYRPDREPVEVDPALSFTSTKKDREADGVGEERPFEVDGEVYVARKPPDEVFILMTTAAAQSTPMPDRVAAIVEFLAETVDDQDFLRLRSRLKDAKDDFGFSDLLDVMQGVVKTFRKGGPKQARALARPPRR